MFLQHIIDVQKMDMIGIGLEYVGDSSYVWLCLACTT